MTRHPQALTRGLLPCGFEWNRSTTLDNRIDPWSLGSSGFIHNPQGLLLLLGSIEQQ